MLRVTVYDKKPYVLGPTMPEQTYLRIAGLIRWLNSLEMLAGRWTTNNDMRATSTSMETYLHHQDAMPLAPLAAYS